MDSDSCDVLDRIEHIARQSFGTLVERPEAGAVVVKTTGAPNPVIITVSGTVGSGKAPIVSVTIAVALRFDWSPGLSDFLLREHATLPFGRFVRTKEDDLWLSYEVLGADCSEAQLSAAVKVLAGVAVNTLLLLSRCGVFGDD